MAARAVRGVHGHRRDARSRRTLRPQWPVLVGGAAVAAAAVLLFPALPTAKPHRRPLETARFHERLTGQILEQQGVTQAVISMAGTGRGRQNVLVRADLLAGNGGLQATSLQLEYLPSGIVCKGRVLHVARTAFDGKCRTPSGATRSVSASWRLLTRTTSSGSSTRGRLRRSALLLVPLLAAGCASSRHPAAQPRTRPADPVAHSTRPARPVPGVAQRVLHLPPITAWPAAGYLLIADRGNNRTILVSPAKKIVWRRTGLRGPDDAFFTPGYRTVITNEEFNDTLTEVSLRSKRRIWRYGHDAVAGLEPGLPEHARRRLPAPERGHDDRGHQELPDRRASPAASGCGGSSADRASTTRREASRARTATRRSRTAASS